MKRQLLLFTIMLTFFSAINAQTKYTATVLTDPVSGYSSGNTPIRNWRTNYSISFQRSATKPFFCLIDNTSLLSTPTTPVPPPICPVIHSFIPMSAPYQGLTVNDIYIVDDIAFFCGSIADTSLGKIFAIWGYFNIMDFYGSSMNIEFNAIIGPPSDTSSNILERIVAYPLGASYTVVTYGREINSGQNKIVEIPNAMGCPSSCNVFLLPYRPAPNMGRLYIDDMTMTENFVVFSGHDNYSSANAYVWYGCYNKNSFSLGSNYRLPDAGETNGHVVCTELNPNEDFFALDYTFYDNDNRLWYNRLRVIDINTMTNPFSQQFNNDEKIEPLRMTYLPGLESIELIQEDCLTSLFTLMHPFYSTPYYASRLIPPGELYYNIDKIGGHHFIAACGSVFYFQDRTMNVPASTTLCPKDQNVEIEIIDKLEPVLRSPFPPGTLYNVCRPVIGTVLPDVMKVDCYSYE